MRVAIVVILACSAMATASGLAQAPVVIPPRDAATPAPPPRGSGAIAGTVTSTDAPPTPIRRATVTLRQVAQPQQPSRARTSITDDHGRFSFSDLTAGQFSISVSKPAYVVTSYGAGTLRGQGLTIALADGERVSDLVVRMPRGAVITGRIVDQSGRPAIGTRVGISEIVTVNGERTFRTNFGTGGDVDDRGIYRIFGVPPGTYVVGTNGAASNASGPPVTTATEVQWALGRGLGIGSGRGDTPPPRGQGIKGAPVFYPGTPDAASASTITLAAGEERAGIDFTASYVPTSAIAGRALRPDGTTARNVSVVVVPTLIPVQVGFPVFPPRATVSADGTFSVAGLTPGRYILSARGSSGTTGPPTTGRGAPPVQDLWAQVEVDVVGQDLTGVALTLMPGMSVSGRVVVESRGMTTPDLTNARLQLRAPPTVAVSVGAAAAMTSADGNFRIEAVAPGPYLLSAFLSATTGPVATLTAKSAVLDGRDILDVPFEVRPGVDTTGLVVTFTDQISEVSGLLTDRAGRPASSYFVIVYSTHTAAWQQGSRRIRMPTRPASDGRFRIAGLPPGEYYLAALSEYDPQEWYTPAFLQQLVPMSLKVTLGDGEKKVQDLKIAQ